jgi:hypothetical protein
MKWREPKIDGINVLEHMKAIGYEGKRSDGIT